jgi:aminomethyltransferase
VREHIQTTAGSWQVKIEDLTESTSMVAVQGPKVMQLIGEFSSEVPALKRYSFCIKNLLVLKMTISRTGYTGEDGVELIMGAAMAPMAIKLLFRHQGNGAKDALMPAGLGARDTLRMEAGMPLYGHELDETIDPISAGLGFAVSLDKDTYKNSEPFIGQSALKQIAADGPKRSLCGLRLDGKRTPRQHMPVHRGDKTVGHVTSGCLSPTLGHPIAMAYVKNDDAEVGTRLNIEIGGNQIEAQVVARPFYTRP